MLGSSDYNLSEVTSEVNASSSQKVQSQSLGENSGFVWGAYSILGTVLEASC